MKILKEDFKISKDLYDFVKEYKQEINYNNFDVLFEDAWDTSNLNMTDYINLCLVVRRNFPNAINFMTKMPRYFYYESDFTTYKIPRNINTLGRCCFEQSDYLTDVYIPKEVKVIGYLVFNLCYRLKNIYYEGTEQEWIDLVKNTYSSDFINKVEVHYNSKM